MTTTTGCESCDAAMINGVYCHELGCPDAWQDYGNDCKWCGSDFQPENRYQDCCDDDCLAAYSGW